MGSHEIGVVSQVEVGWLTKNDWSRLVVVLAESWSFVLDSLGCSNVLTYSECQSEDAKAEFATAHLGSTFLNKLDEILQMCIASGLPIICIQGSEKFCLRMVECTRGLSYLSRVVVRPTGPDEESCAAQIDGKFISHWEVGGLTDGRWVYECDQSLTLEPSSLRRNLDLVLNPINCGMLEEEFLSRCRGNEHVLSGQDVL